MADMSAAVCGIRVVPWKGLLCFHLLDKEAKAFLFTETIIFSRRDTYAYT